MAKLVYVTCSSNPMQPTRFKWEIQALRPGMYIKTGVQIAGTFPSSFFPLTYTPTNPSVRVIHKPYPTTYCCPVPPGDKTNKPLCQALLVKVNLPCLKYPLPSLVHLRGWTQNEPVVSTPKALTGMWAKKEASVNAGVKTPPGSGCEFFTSCDLRKCDGGLMVLRRG